MPWYPYFGYYLLLWQTFLYLRPRTFDFFQNPSLHIFAVSQKCIHFAPLCCVFNVKKLEQKVEVYLTAQYIWQPVNIISTISAICLTRLLNFYNCLLLLWRPPGQVKRGDLRIIFKDDPRSAFFWLLTNKEEAQFLTGPLVPDYHATLFFIWYQSIFFNSQLNRGKSDLNTK